MDIEKSDEIVALLNQVTDLLPNGCAVAMVIVMPPDANGWQAGHTIDNEMDKDTREFAAEILSSHEAGHVLSRQVN